MNPEVGLLSKMDAADVTLKKRYFRDRHQNNWKTRKVLELSAKVH
jgi:hypothetical protein